MKIRSTILSLLLGATAIITACSDNKNLLDNHPTYVLPTGPNGQQDTLTSFSIVPIGTIDIGPLCSNQTRQAIVSGLMTSGKTISQDPSIFTWTTSDASVATVDTHGLVRGVKMGSATITATLFGSTKNASTVVTVTSSASCNTAEVVPVSSITISPKTASVQVGGKQTFVATILPSTAAQTVTWRSTNTNAIVDQNGLATGVAVGTAGICGKAVGNLEDCAILTVVASTPDVTITQPGTVTLSIRCTAGFILQPGYQTTYQLQVVGPVNTSNAVTITSINNQNIAVSQTGLISAALVGQTILLVAPAANPTAVVRIDVNVVNGCVANTGPALTPGSGTIYAPNGNCGNTTLQLAVTNGVAVTSWTSSNTAVATVSSTGLVTTITQGTVTITARAANNAVGTATITVAQCPSTTGPVLSPSTVVIYTPAGNCGNTTRQLDVTNGVAVTSWTSSDPTVATVSSTGLVTAIKVGTVTITARAANNATGTSNITVALCPTSSGPDFTLTPASDSGKVGTFGTITVTYSGIPTGFDTNLLWSTSSGSSIIVSKYDGYNMIYNGTTVKSAAPGGTLYYGFPGTETVCAQFAVNPNIKHCVTRKAFP
ncbi:MAG: hypothetical protein JWL80_353 [Parcubacteria group bacterium]|nr:hypothetical protein [Parcubacteria group bacterium]